MDISEETQKLGSNPLARYAILLIGLLILFVSEGMLTWKRTAEQDAAGNVAAIQLEINQLELKVADKESSSEDKKAWQEEIKELRENELVDARMEAASESVDAKNGVWLLGMARIKGMAIISVGLLIVAATGGTHEKLGSLIALGLILARL